MSKRTTHLIIEGKVQGVYYRAWLQQQAQQLNLSGWTRNCSNGTVEAVICGDEVSTKKLITLCHQGPILAQVARIHQQPTQPYLQPNFTIRNTQ